MTDILTWVVAFIVAISVLVAVHEFGHYWVARKLGIKVLRFSIGFGKPIWKKVAGRDQTEYVISSLPLGGYVKMLDEREGPVDEEERHRTFNNAPISSRLAVLAAGPAFNFLFAILVYWITFMLGVTELRPVVAEIAPDSYAARAGVVAGDEILAVGSQRTRTWQDATLAIIDDLVDDGVIALSIAGDRGGDRGGEREVIIDVGEDKHRLTEPGELLEGIGLRIWPTDLPAVIGQLVEGEAAANAGFRTGDRIVSADGEAIDGWTAWYEYVRAHPGRVVDVRTMRDGRELNIVLAIGEMSSDGETVGRIGAGPQTSNDERRIEVSYGPLEAGVKAVSYTGEMTAFTVRMLWRMVSGDFSARNLSGPITIAQYAGDTARLGPEAFLSFLAIVSISLGILNLMPIPILDGGQMVYQVAEAIKGSPLSPVAELRGQQVGIVLLLGLMSLAFYNDILRLLG